MFFPGQIALQIVDLNKYDKKCYDIQSQNERHILILRNGEDKPTKQKIYLFLLRNLYSIHYFEKLVDENIAYFC